MGLVHAMGKVVSREGLSRLISSSINNVFWTAQADSCVPVAFLAGCANKFSRIQCKKKRERERGREIERDSEIAKGKEAAGTESEKERARERERDFEGAKREKAGDCVPL